MTDRERTTLSELPARVTRWVLAAGESRWAPPILVAFTVAEATVFPAPTEALLLALCVSKPARAPLFALMAASGSVAGAYIGYGMGAHLFTEVGQPLLAMLGVSDLMPRVAGTYRENMALALLTSGYTPIPYLLYTIVAGAFELPLGPFLGASFVGRALKYAPIALVAWWLGATAHAFLARHAARAGILITLAVIAVVAWRVV